MKNKTLKNIIIVITIIIASVLTACGQVATLSDSIQSKLFPLDGEVAPTSLHNEMLITINSMRTQGTICNDEYKSSVLSVYWNKELAGASKTQVKDILNRVKSGEINIANKVPPHLDSTGGYVDDRVIAQGYSFEKAGEILASTHNGATSITGVIQTWKASSNHCNTIMASDFEEVGIYFESGVWAVVFGDPTPIIEMDKHLGSYK